MTTGIAKGEDDGRRDPPRPPDAPARTDPPLIVLTLWPHRSLSRRGFRWVLVIAGIGLTVPLVPLWGTPVALGLAPFLLLALLGLYLAIRRSYFDGRLTEELRLWPDLLTVERREPDGRVLRWQANPFWVRPTLLRGAHVENYLILRGSGREIELGAFLSPEERLALHGDLVAALGRLRSAGAARPV
jgi:uncharacterized membrane protein